MEDSIEDVDVATFPFANSIIKKLIEAGFKTHDDFIDVKPLDLCREVGIPQDVALQILAFALRGEEPPLDEELVQSTPAQTSTTIIQEELQKYKKAEQEKMLSGMNMTSALDKLAQETSTEKISTMCKELDDFLGGGVALRALSEFIGVPGVGKTQLALQLSLCAQLPKEFGGVGGKTFYIDTEGSFHVDRLKQIAEGLVKHWQNVAIKSNNRKTKELAANLSVEGLLQGVIVYRVLNHTELLSLLTVLPSYCLDKQFEQNKLRLVIIDSITTHFRDFQDYHLRSRLLQGVANHLRSVANQHELAVLFSNQVTTKLGAGKADIVPALGDSWSHICAIRVMLYWRQGRRYAHLAKHVSNQATDVQYAVTEDGIRSVEEK